LNCGLSDRLVIEASAGRRLRRSRPVRFIICSGAEGIIAAKPGDAPPLINAGLARLQERAG
jgi:hypothetical protein